MPNWVNKKITKKYYGWIKKILITKWIRVAAKIPPALLNALAKLSRPAPRAALTIRNTAKY